MSLCEDAHGAKRQRILQGAEVVFSQRGYEGASMSRIAVKAGVSKGTLYNYFDCKSHLFAVFVETKTSASLAPVFQSIDEDDDPLVTLTAIGRGVADIVASPASVMLYRIAVSEADKFPHLASLFWEAGPSRGIRHLTAWIERQVEKGRLTVDDPEFAAEQFLALCQTRITFHLPLLLDTDITPAGVEKVVDGAVRLFLGAYRR
jgi:TetR/AcrR family transcriptional repressor of mexJK operon